MPRRTRRKPHVDPDAVNAEGNTALFNAARDNNLTKVQELIVSGADINKGRSVGNSTPLFIASSSGYTSIVKTLINAGADVNRGSPTPLYMACFFGYTEVVKELIDAGADLNIPNDDGLTPLFNACYRGHIEIANMLVHAGADINKALNGALNNNYPEVVEMLISAGADVNQTMTDDGETPLYIASKKGYTDVIKILIDAGADVNKAIVYNGATPVYIASINNNPEVVKMLISAGADVNKEFTYSFSSSYIYNVTSLYIACQKGYIDIVKLLIDAGVDVNKARTDTGETPLCTATNKGYTKIVKMLIYAGVDVNKARTDTGETPLYIACFKKHIDIINILLSIPGIDKSYAINGAKRGEFTKEIAELILGKPELWQGWTRSDIDRMNEIFDDTTAPNITLCPVCLKITARDKGCMHMKHNCTALPGFYHKQLYSMYNEDGKIHWCTICGRIGYSEYGGDFYHYKLGLANDGRPGKHGPTYVLDESCATRSGGGGLDEKFKRFQKIREKAFNLNTPEYINKITEKQAKEMLVEAMWNAPIESTSNINAIKATKSWNIPNTDFPVNVVKEKPNEPNVPTPPTHLDPIVHPEETEEFQNATMISDTDIIQFRHEGNMHDKEGQQISRKSFFSMLQTNLINPVDEGYLKCWAYSQEEDNHCAVKLYPREVRIGLGLAEVPEEGENADYRKLYELYRKKFNEAEAGVAGGARKHRTRRRRRH
jgi:ankyrin repeat protein